jgi:hypothetical protein
MIVLSLQHITPGDPVAVACSLGADVAVNANIPDAAQPIRKRSVMNIAERWP